MAVAKIEFDGITKAFPGVVANDNVTIRVAPGTVHGIVGENGAGKTTLMNILYGLYQPDSGRVVIDGTPVTIDEPSTAIAHGIGMVHQHFMLVDRFTVTENIMLGSEVARNGFIDRREAHHRISKLEERYGMKLDPRALVADISVGMQQRVEILKCLYRDAQVLVLDEPTGVLTPQEIDELLLIVRRLAEAGRTVLFISHKLEEVKNLCDRVTVLRLGQVVADREVDELTPQQIASLMVGQDVQSYENERRGFGGFRLMELDSVNVYDDRKVRVLKDVSLALESNHILGVAGVDGNGQRELVEAITGMRKIESGTFAIAGTEMTNRSVAEIRSAGVAHIPEDRQKHGMVMDFTVEENMVLGRQGARPFARSGVLNKREVRSYAKTLVERFDVRPGIPTAKSRQLSGGNQQKAIIARELTGEPAVVVAVQPTRGLDIGAGQFVWKSLLGVKERGGGVLLVSLDLDEVFALSDTIAVIFDGRIMAVVKPEDTTREELGLLMTGAETEATEVTE